MLASPINLLLFGALAGVLLCYGRHARFGRGLALAAILILLAAATLPLCARSCSPRWKTGSLSRRPTWQPPYGIIVLGGAIDDPIERRPRPDRIRRGRRADHRGGHSGQAVSAGARRLHQRHQLGARREFDRGGCEPETSWLRWASRRDRVTIEDKARNTDENARFTAAIVHPEPSQRWLIVTSAFHMPRAMGVFEKAGFHPIAYPVSFYTLGGG